MLGRHRGVNGQIDEFSVICGLLFRAIPSGAASESRRVGATKRPVAHSKRIQRPTANLIDRDRVLARATDVIGSRKEATKWLETPVRALGSATPMSLLVDPAGEDQVLALLDNLDHGVL